MFCKKCGNSVDNNSTYCPYCGEKLKFENDFNTNDNVGGYISILTFLFPIVGIILFFCWKHEKPNSAKKALLGTLIFVVCVVLLTVFSLVCMFI